MKHIICILASCLLLFSIGCAHASDENVPVDMDELFWGGETAVVRLWDEISEPLYEDDLDQEKRTIRLASCAISYLSIDGNEALVDLVFRYKLDVSIADVLPPWMIRPRWDGDTCFSRHRLLIQRKNEQWQLWGIVPLNISTEGFRKLTNNDQRITHFVWEQFGITYFGSTRLPGDSSLLPQAVLDVTMAEPSQFCGTTVGEESSREITVHVDEGVPVPRVGDRVRIFVWNYSVPSTVDANSIMVVQEELPEALVLGDKSP